MKVVLPDGSVLSLPEGATASTVAENIGPRLAKAAVAAKVGGKVVDLSTTVGEGDEVGILTMSTPEGVETMRHSAAHVLAEAATRMFPGTKVAIGPALRTGSTTTSTFLSPLARTTLPVLAAEIERISAQGAPFERREVSKQEARELFADEPYKLELIQDLPDEKSSAYMAKAGS